METDSKILRCSFCSKTEKAVAKLIAGPSVYICDQCVDICNEILADDRRSPSKGQFLRKIWRKLSNLFTSGELNQKQSVASLLD